MANSYLNKTFSGAPTNAKKGTVSIWFKLSQNDNSSNNYYRLFVTGADANNRTDLNIVKPNENVDSNDLAGRLYFSHIVGGTAYHWRTTRQLRDFSGFYNLVVAYDTTQASASDRVKIYINGTQETSFSASATIPQDTDLFFGNNSSAHHIGNSPHYSPRFFQGYMSHFAYVDGTALAPTVFGETDSTSGIWKFKSPSTTWGNNGVHLKFENSGNLGLDSSGNSHNFTVNGNLKQAVDTPSNVYATLNPLTNDGGGAKTYSTGNTTVVESADNWTTAHSTLGVTTGKWYFEGKVTYSNNQEAYLGACSQQTIQDRVNSTHYLGQTTGSVGYYTGNGSYYKGAGAVSYGSAVSGGDIVGVALDLDNNFIYFSINGTWQNSGDPTSGSSGTNGISLPSGMTSGDNIFLSVSPNQSTINCNFGNGFFGTTAISSAGSNGNGSLFEYDVPNGYYALNTKNLNTYG